MKRILSLFLFLSGCLFFCFPSFASSNSSYPFYIGIQGGYAQTGYGRKWLTDQPGFTSVEKVDGNNFAGRISLGYTFNPYFALEAGFLYLQPIVFKNVNGLNTENEFYQRTGDFFGKITLPIKQFSLYGKAGAALVYRNTMTVSSSAKYDKNNKLTPALGAGSDISFNDHLSAGVFYQYYFKANDLNRVHFYGLELLYNF